MSSTQKHVDVRKIREFVKSGFLALPSDKYHEEAVIVLGDTGVGKSTLLTLLSGAKMFVKYDGIKVSLHSQNSSKTKIGHSKFSQTFIPMKVLTQNIAFFDCPGFNDNQSEQFQIANSFFLQRLLDNYRKIKIIIMVEQSHISEVRADRFPALIHNLFAFFGTFQDIASGCCLIISRANPENEKLDYKEQIMNMIATLDPKSKFFNEEESRLLKFLVENDRILLFREPQRKGEPYEYKMGEEQQQIIPLIKSIKSVKSKHINHHCSESSRLAIRNLIDEIISKSKSKFRVLFSCLTNKLTQEMLLKGDKMESLQQVKKKMEKIQVQIKQKEGKDILQIFKNFEQIPEIVEIEEDIAAVQFFNGLYNKQKFFYQNIKSLLIAESNEVFSRLEKNISLAISTLAARLQRQSLQTEKKIIQKQQSINTLKNKQNQEITSLIIELDEQNKAKQQYYWSKLALAEEQRLAAQRQHDKKALEITTLNKARQQEREIQLERQKESKLSNIKQMEQNQLKKNSEKAQIFQELNKKEIEYCDATSKILEKMKKRSQGLIDKEINRFGQNRQEGSRQKIIIDYAQKLEILTEFTKCQEKKNEKEEEKYSESIKQDTDSDRDMEIGEIQKDIGELKKSTSSLKKLKSFEQKKAEIIIQSLKVEEELSQFIQSIKKRRQNELKQIQKNLEIKSTSQSPLRAEAKNFSYSPSKKLTDSNWHLFSYNERLRESAPAAFSKRRPELPQQLLKTPQKNKEFKPISFQNYKTTDVRRQQQKPVVFSLQQSHKESLKNIKPEHLIIKLRESEVEDRFRASEVSRREDMKIKPYKKSMRPTSSLISQINQVLLNLNNISGDLEKAKKTVIKLSDQNCLPLSHNYTFNTSRSFNQV